MVFAVVARLLPPFSSPTSQQNLLRSTCGSTFPDPRLDLLNLYQIADFKMVIITNKDVASWGAKFDLVVFASVLGLLLLLEELAFTLLLPCEIPGVSSSLLGMVCSVRAVATGEV